LPDEGEPLCDALLDAVQPKIIVVADSEFPANRRASRTLHERLDQRKIPVIYTRASGAVKIVRQWTAGSCAQWPGKRFLTGPRPDINPVTTSATTTVD